MTAMRWMPPDPRPIVRRTVTDISASGRGWRHLSEAMFRRALFFSLLAPALYIAVR